MTFSTFWSNVKRTFSRPFNRRRHIARRLNSRMLSASSGQGRRWRRYSRCRRLPTVTGPYPVGWRRGNELPDQHAEHALKGTPSSDSRLLPRPKLIPRPALTRFRNAVPGLCGIWKPGRRKGNYAECLKGKTLLVEPVRICGEFVTPSS